MFAVEPGEVIRSYVTMKMESETVTNCRTLLQQVWQQILHHNFCQTMAQDFVYIFSVAIYPCHFLPQVSRMDGGFTIKKKFCTNTWTFFLVCLYLGKSLRISNKQIWLGKWYVEDMHIYRAATKEWKTWTRRWMKNTEGEW